MADRVSEEEAYRLAAILDLGQAPKDYEHAGAIVRWLFCECAELEAKLAEAERAAPFAVAASCPACEEHGLAGKGMIGGTALMHPIICAYCKRRFREDLVEIHADGSERERRGP